MIGKVGELTIHDKLSQIAANLWWSWDPELVEVFRLIDTDRFAQLHNNPVQLLAEYTPELLEQRARAAVLHSRIHWAYRRFVEYTTC